MTGKFGSARGGSADLRRKILRNVQNLHPWKCVASVIRKLERALVTKRPATLHPALDVAIPSRRILRKNFIAGQLVHDSQLYNVQSVVERAGHHGKQRAGLLI